MSEHLIPIHKTEFIREPMSPELLMLSIMLNGNPERVLLMERNVLEHKFYQLIDLRLNAVGVKVERAVRMFLFTMLDSPHHVSIYVHCLWHLYGELGASKPITLHQFFDLFADGFPTRDSLDQFWVNQKRDKHNAVDMVSTYISGDSGKSAH